MSVTGDENRGGTADFACRHPHVQLQRHIASISAKLLLASLNRLHLFFDVLYYAA
jgi:hypothetical protein